MASDPPMPQNADFQTVFEKLKSIFKPYEKKLIVTQDTATDYELDTPFVMKNKHRIYFGGVRVGRAYVSFHLMPVYASTDLVKGMSPDLKKRMQGKSCFNFKKVDAKLFKELAELTKAGFKTFTDPKFLEKITR
jgi:hypothetical protein